MKDSARLVPRLVESDDCSQLFTATHSILSLIAPRKSLDSLVVMPGLGEHTRVTRAIHMWEKNPHINFLIISGSNKDEKEQPQLSLDILKEAPFLLTRLKNVLTQVEANHTREQTDWIIDQAIKTKISNIGLVVSHWHMPRAYMTLLKSMLNANLQIPIYPIVVGISPKDVVPELQVTVKKASAGEAARIKKYQKIGQIASFDELMTYLEWLYSKNDTSDHKE